jgi:hypothetical protein
MEPPPNERSKMANAAYVVLESGSINLAYTGDDPDTDHTISFDADKLDAGKPAVLSFDMNPGDDDDVSVVWRLNNTEVLKQSFNVGRDARAWQAVVPKNILKTHDNKLTVELNDDDKKGSINFTDLVIVYTQKP